MFRCQLNKDLSNPGEKIVRLVVEKRFVEYKNAEGEKVSEGWEIVKELWVRSSNVEKAKARYGIEDQEVKDWR
jgi:hypothetical protein